MSEQPAHKKYKVTLKTGEWAIFSNDNNFDNYEDRLVSGIYGIVTGQGSNRKITSETVASIEEITDDSTEDAADDATEKQA